MLVQLLAPGYQRGVSNEVQLSLNFQHSYISSAVTYNSKVISAKRKHLIEARSLRKAVPKIKIEVLNVFTSKTNTCVANIKVIVGDEDCTVLNVCDVIEYNDDKLVVALKAYKV